MTDHGPEGGPSGQAPELPGELPDELPDPERVDPAVLTTLLAGHGWRRHGGEQAPYSRWTPPGGPGPSLLVPTAPGAGDYAELLAETLTALARCGTPSAREVLLALSVPGDEIRWRCATPRVGGAVAWTAAERLHRAARGMLMAAARATLGSARYFGARHEAQAAAWLDHVLIGPARGADEIVAYAPVPEGRAVTTTLLRALQATRDAVDYQRATGGLQAFDAAVGLGVCHELLHSLARAVRGTEGVRVALVWSPAAAPPGPARPEPVEFSPGDLPALRRAADRALSTEPPVPVEIAGAVVRLRSARPRDGGTVWLRVLSGAEVRRVRVALDGRGYRAAVRAHLDGLPLRVSGRLESRDGFRRLTAQGPVAAVEVDEAERDRLWKSLAGPGDPFAEGG